MFKSPVLKQKRMGAGLYRSSEVYFFDPRRFYFSLSRNMLNPSVTWYILPLEIEYLANSVKVAIVISSIWHVHDQCQQLTNRHYKKFDHVVYRLRTKSFRFESMDHRHDG